MELRHIRYFIAVAEELNFTRAAARLGIGQPPLSQQIKDLETEIGVLLLRRVPHGAELTPAGENFLTYARLTIENAERAAAAAVRAARGELGRLRLGFTNSAHFNPAVPALIGRFGRQYPKLSLDVAELNTHELIEGLAADKLDVVFTRANLVADTRFQFLTIVAEPLVAVLPIDHRCTGSDPIEVVDLAEDRFIIKPRAAAPALHAAILHACRRADFEPNTYECAPQLASIISFVAAGLGVSLVPESLQQIKAAGVAFRPVSDPEAKVTLSAAWRRTERSAVVRNFIALVRDAFRKDASPAPAQVT